MTSQDAYKFIIKGLGKPWVGEQANWHLFNEECIKQIPSDSGIYLMRFEKIARVFGSSDLYYIGISKNLKTRLRTHWKGNNYKYAFPIVTELYKKNKIEVVWIEADSEIAEKAEVKCLVEFFKKHLELPAGNSNIRNYNKYFTQEESC